MKLVTTRQMAEIEQQCAAYGISTSRLMENAGRAVAEQIHEICPGLENRQVVFLIGPGNNGGDGLVAARHLAGRGAKVLLVIPVEKPANADNLQRALEAGAIKVAGPDNLKEAVHGAHVLVDALFGTGCCRPIEGDYAALLRVVSASKPEDHDVSVFALDIPSGIDSDSGNADPLAVMADFTLTLGMPKKGMFNSDNAIAHCGQIRVLDIGIPSGLAGDIVPELMAAGQAEKLLPRRPASGHKGTFGSLLVVAGSASYPGAARLCSAAALRSGAGLVRLAITSGLQPSIAPALSEVVYSLLDERAPGEVEESAIESITRQAEKHDALLIGCGLGRSSTADNLVSGLLFETGTGLPAVIDADALNILADIKNWPRKLRPGSILTPHPGEMGRLLGLNPSDIQADRIGTALRTARETNQVMVLKGAGTVVAGPDGQLSVNPFAGAVLATAGTGDVLAGIIAGLLAQKLPPFDAARLGVFIHAESGKALSYKMGDAGVLAGDLLEQIPLTIKQLRQMRYN